MVTAIAMQQVITAAEPLRVDGADKRIHCFHTQAIMRAYSVNSSTANRPLIVIAIHFGRNASASRASTSGHMHARTKCMEPYYLTGLT